MSDLSIVASRIGNAQVIPVTPKPSAKPTASAPTSSDADNVSDALTTQRSYLSFNFKEEAKFKSPDNTTVRTITEGHVESKIAMYAGRIAGSSNNAEKRKASAEIVHELTKLGSLTKLSPELLEKIKNITGIESDEELQVISEIINDPNYQKYFSDKLSAFEISKILKELDGQGKENFLQAFMSHLKEIPNNPDQSIKNIISLVNATCVSKNIVFNDNLHAIENRCNPFLNEQEIKDKKTDENKPVTLAELKVRGQLNSERYEGVATLLGIGKKTEANVEASSKISIPQWLADMIIQSSEEDLPKLLEQYRDFISVPGKSKKEDKTVDKPKPNTVKPPTTGAPEDVNTGKKTEGNSTHTTAPNETSTKAKEILDKIKSSGVTKQNINELIEFFKNNKFSDLSSDLVKEIESTIGIKDSKELNLLDKLLNSSGYSASFESSLSIPNLTKILSSLKGTDKKLLLNSMLACFTNGTSNLTGATELIKTACRDKKIVFNQELHNTSDRCNPLLSSQDVEGKKQKENEMVSLTDVEKNLKIQVIKRSQFLFGLIKGRAHKTETTENEISKVEIPRWLSDLMSSAQTADQLKKIVEDNRDFIKITQSTTSSTQRQK